MQTLDTMIAWDLDAHVMGMYEYMRHPIVYLIHCWSTDGYEFLMQNCALTMLRIFFSDIFF